MTRKIPDLYTFMYEVRTNAHQYLYIANIKLGILQATTHLQRSLDSIQIYYRTIQTPREGHCQKTLYEVAWHLFAAPPLSKDSQEGEVSLC